MDQFKPTHDITVHFHDGDVGHYPVMLVDGAAYTHIEWASCDQADWECSPDGTWTFHGQPAPPGATQVVVETRR